METVKELHELERQVERASLFTQASLEKLVNRASGVEAFLMQLVGTLREKGILDGADPAEDEPAEPPPTETAIARRPEEAVAVSWPAIAIAVEPEEAPAPVEVNCAERMHVCHAVCCKLNFALTAGEVDAGKVKWDLGYPYYVRRNADGWCTHHDRDSGACGVYADRPGVCRRYSCANDGRIWKDFDAMVLNSAWLDENLSEPTRIRLRQSLPLMQPPEASTGE